jgi:hypothetical protein
MEIYLLLTSYRWNWEKLYVKLEKRKFYTITIIN